MAQGLNLFKASAGSGKTFALTVEYIKLLIKNPQAYRHILAVTFTNKATGEMKERILNTLKGLADRDKSADGYLMNIKKDSEIEILDDETIAAKAQMALTNILHDYSRFRIETIDSFFQSIIRNLAHELSLTANLRVDLDQDKVLSDAVRNIIENLQADKSALYLAVKSFVEENIETGHNWKINSDVESFGKNIFKEVYLNNEDSLSKAVADPKFFEEYKQELKQLKDDTIQSIKTLASQFFALCNLYGCNDSDLFFQKAKGPFGYMTKLSEGLISAPTKHVLKCLDREADLSKDPTVSSHENELLEVLDKAAQAATDGIIVINSVNLVMKHINQMRLLSAVDQKVRELNHQANRFLLADTAHFLSKMISDSDIPFIYEKSGTTFQHIMIDEFQDTSSLQWNNFCPLLHNSLDSGYSCLIVGDVKQSIYRWRNAEWEILNTLNQSAEFSSQVNLKTLDTNYRSAERIIAFNNKLFEAILKEVESQDVKQAYSDVEQQYAAKNTGIGYVHIDSFPKEQYKDNALKCIVDTIDMLLSNQVRQKDITLLLRTNRQISTISTYLAAQRPEIKIVSDEAYRLDSSIAINIIVLALKVVSNREDRLSLTTLLLMMGEKAPFTMTDNELFQLLPPAFIQRLDELALLPLTELCHTLYIILSIDKIKGQDAYLMCFYDRLNEYVKDGNIDIPNFINWWDEKLSSVNIPAGSIDGIRAMTIHKSKGLEFHTVICPYCDWKTGVDSKELIWCQPTEAPFNHLPLTAISCTKDTMESIFSSDYKTEETKCLVDSLNILYVALTRASKNLFIITGKKEKYSGMYEILDNAFQKLKNAADTIDECQCEYDGGTAYEFGTLVPSDINNTETEKTDTDDITDKNGPLHLTFVSTPSNAEFRQSNKSMQFIGTLEDEQSEADKLRYINEGLAVHRFLELLRADRETEDIIEQLNQEGYFENDTYRQSILKLIQRALDNKQAMSWFSDGWREFNECTILSRDAKGNHVERRPDRVITDSHETLVIDYKTGRTSEEHKQQLRTYMSLLSQMGYPSVRGLLWYIRHDEIVEVEHET